MSEVLLPPGVNPIAVKYMYHGKATAKCFYAVQKSKEKADLAT
jgi:hypothetical protein